LGFLLGFLLHFIAKTQWQWLHKIELIQANKVYLAC